MLNMSQRREPDTQGQQQILPMPRWWWIPDIRHLVDPPTADSGLPLEPLPREQP